MALYAATGMRAPAPAAPSQPYSGPQPYGMAAPAVNDDARRLYANNAYAQAAGVDRGALAGMGKAGVSRGMGMQRYADLAQRGAYGKAAGDVLNNENEASVADASARSAYDNAMRAEETANKGLLEDLRHTEAGKRLAQRGWSENLYEAQRRGQYGLDSLYMPASAFMSAFFRQ